MRRFEDMCQKCDTCYAYCKYRNPIQVLVCDKCHREVDRLFADYGVEVCERCLDYETDGLDELYTEED